MVRCPLSLLCALHLISRALVIWVSLVLFNTTTCLSNDMPSTKNDKDSSKTHSGGTGTTVAIICLAVAAVVLFSFFLFKLWQKKKREEQYARLLKLFEEHDELEVELGFRD
ncbi:hypothetical protein RND81_08G082400 [Saponaria officinalis]|uniref:Uncharacterized protein n=1 Tax=Saponaria officinalis TaxID=3572 RepID=A0AAW1J5V1_SAPOF